MRARGVECFNDVVRVPAGGDDDKASLSGEGRNAAEVLEY